ncbi:MAG: response regulator [Sphingomonas sp.]
MVLVRKRRRLSRLVIVGDEPLVAFNAEHSLVEDGFEIVVTLDRVAEATALLEGGTRVDLVLVDVDLADGSELDVARAAHRLGITVLFTTGNRPPGASALAAGLLAKPYAMRDLRAAIAALELKLSGILPTKLPKGFTLLGGNGPVENG